MAEPIVVGPPFSSTYPGSLKRPAHQRPGGIGGSSSGARDDPGREGIMDLGDAEGRIPSHSPVA